jgi:hypothetical protein
VRKSSKEGAVQNIIEARFSSERSCEPAANRGSNNFLRNYLPPRYVTEESIRLLRKRETFEDNAPFPWIEPLAQLDLSVRVSRRTSA